MISRQWRGIQIMRMMREMEFDDQADLTPVFTDSGKCICVDLSGFEVGDDFEIIDTIYGQKRCQKWIEKEDCTNHYWVPV